MKKLLIVLTSVFFCTLMSSAVVFAETNGEAEVLAEVQVLSNVAVTPEEGAVMGTIQTGGVSGTFTFLVESNQQTVTLCVGATHLYKGGVSDSEEYIPVDTDVSATVNPTATAAAVSAELAFNATEEEIKSVGFMGHKTACADFESGQAEIFNSPVEIGLSWLNEDNILPEGTYKGYVKLYVSII